MLADMPSMIVELQRTIGDLTATLAALKETVARAQRVSARVESVVDEVEGPIRMLRPGIERLASALDDPVIDRIPETLLAVERVIHPLAASVDRLRRGRARLAASCRRLSRHIRSRRERRTDQVARAIGRRRGSPLRQPNLAAGLDTED
jgi:phage shock protein A